MLFCNVMKFRKIYIFKNVNSFEIPNEWLALNESPGTLDRQVRINRIVCAHKRTATVSLPVIYIVIIQVYIKQAPHNRKFNEICNGCRRDGCSLTYRFGRIPLRSFLSFSLSLSFPLTHHPLQIYKTLEFDVYLPPKVLIYVTCRWFIQRTTLFI